MSRALVVTLSAGLGALAFLACEDKKATEESTAQAKIELKQVTADMSLGQAAYTHTSNIVAHGPRPPATLALKAVRDYSTVTLNTAGWSTRLQRLQADLPATAQQRTGKSVFPFTNLRARFGRDEEVWQRTPTALLCAHIDSKLMPTAENFVGADDAGSAVAAILVVARELAAKHPAIAAEIEIVFFDGEEAIGDNMGPTRGGFDGLYGSRHYADAWKRASEKPAFGLLLDMIGHKDLSFRLPSDSPTQLLIPLRSAAQKNGSYPLPLSAGPILDDHVPLNLAGIPTIDLIGDFASKPWWHHQGNGRDDMSIISAESLDFSVRTTIDFLLDQVPKYSQAE